MTKPSEKPATTSSHLHTTGADDFLLTTTGDSLQTPPPPDSISPEAGEWWTKITDEYSIDDPAGFLLLQTALESFDRMRQAQQTIAAEGATIADRFEQQKPHPLLVTERDSRSQMLQAMKLLKLDFAPGES